MVPTAHAHFYRTQDWVCRSPENFPRVRRLLSLPIALVDAGLETLKTPLTALEEIVNIVIQVIGPIFGANGCSMKQLLQHTEMMLDYAATTPVALIHFFPKTAYQFYHTLFHPTKAPSVRHWGRFVNYPLGPKYRRDVNSINTL